VRQNRHRNQDLPGRGPDATGLSDTQMETLAPTGQPTPMMAQYLAIKAEHPGSLLFYRMGDFYELFFDDAVAAAAALDITLTRRGKHHSQDIPMCGVPVVSHETYLERLIRAGFKVAICEQTENPAEARKRGGAKTLVARDVVRVVTAGTLTEDTLLDARRNNYLAAVAEVSGARAIAWLDVSTGELLSQPLAPGGLSAALARLEPSEILLNETVVADAERHLSHSERRSVLTVLPASRFDSVNAAKRLHALFAVDTLDGFGAFGRAEVAACGALVEYVSLTQKGRLPRISPPARLADGTVMDIDGATRRNLELTRTLSGERRGSVIDTIDRTVTGAGGRLLMTWLNAPLTDPPAIHGRLDAVQYFHDNDRPRETLRTALGRFPDIERALARLTVGRGGPRDLAAIRDGLALIGTHIQCAVTENALSAVPRPLAATLEELGDHGTLIRRLDAALVAEPPAWTRDGGFIARGYSADLDDAVRLRDEGRSLIAALETRYQQETGLTGLKVRHNNILGYFVEVPARQADKLSGAADSPFIHRQTMTSAVRYATVELAELEGRIARAGAEALSLERSLYQTLVDAVAATAAEIARTARAVAALDVSAALAELAREARYVRPEVDGSLRFEIKAGRHPVVEASGRTAGMAAGSGGEPTTFVANGCDLGDGHRLWLLTGPNMAGKSTFLRQNALITILAQMGAFVPADQARIGVVDRLFSRVGAADDLARGRSTFMVEMVETAAILNQAGERALVILDEIGRGTATFDGLSIAWAVIEHLHDVNHCRGLFATHYHELTALAARLDDLACHTVRVKEWQGDVVFLHEVVPGAADRSYGIHVGRLAGLPARVLERAEQVLGYLETDERAASTTRLADDLPLFAATLSHEPPATAVPSAVEQAVREINPDALSPREALDLIYRLKGQLVEKA